MATATIAQNITTSAQDLAHQAQQLSHTVLTTLRSSFTSSLTAGVTSVARWGRTVQRPAIALTGLSALLLAGWSLTAHPVAASTGMSSLPNGIYVRGSSPIANQVGETYMVFSVRDGRVIGGFYMPQSSFDCFYGSLEYGAMPLTVVDSYTQDNYTYAVNLGNEAIVADASQQVMSNASPESMYELATISEVDRQVLTTCQNSLGNVNF